ncbi:hypothetical protein M2333_002852 [Sphingobium sp. B11D3B]|uniref:hypothetical protein n=1 Tax=Sphingobium sp. B11D3B TaxID=2940575 RepID=UPI002227A57C|nr:hypothetical protein [Sphingobium sp. B11D3B]MCW2389806.1 hypothetical protein [Sphingobium sp. B11D3B]
MIELSEDEWRRAFSAWLRTGKVASVPKNDAIECKFNPWHDPEDGRFTFAGSGNYHGRGRPGPASRTPGNVSRGNLRIARTPTPETSSAKQPQGFDKRPNGGTGSAAQPRPAGSPREQPNPAAEFVGGVGEGLYGVAKETVVGVRSVLTTNPVTTVRNAGRGIAAMIDTAIAAEDTPAHTQISRAADAVANASARDIGRAAGSAVGNAALAVAPSAVVGKVAALRRLRGTVPRPPHEPPQIGWVKENLGPETRAKRYNDAATGARPGQAPTLMRTMPDGSRRPVKFDGVQGEYVIDRKFKVVDAPHARAQLLRQSEALAHNRSIGTWEVPNEAQRIAALKLFKKMKITNIKVRVVKP